MSGNGQRGRPVKPYRTTWGKDVPGLRRKGDGRWEIRSKGVRFTEPDERKAVQRAEELLGINRPEYTAVEGRVPPPPLPRLNDIEFDNHSFTHDYTKWKQDIPDGVLYPWIANEIATNLDEFARKVGNLDLLKLKHLPAPAATLRLSTITKSYQQHNPATAKAKKEALAPLNRLIKYCKAETLDDLTTSALLDFKSHIEETVEGSATRRAYYSRIRCIIAFGLKIGLDALQIRAALDRAKVLWTTEPLPSVDPTPIAPEAFGKLLTAGRNAWKPWLLLGLNLCLHMEEVCALQWKQFNFDAGTYATIRHKTRRQRIPRAATLWPETMEAVKPLPRKGDYLFISTHGTRYNKNTRVNDFRELADSAGLKKVTFDWIRDGAYTAACHGTTDERLARVFAGHRAHGLQDNYVLRNPEIVKPACEAVYARYKEAIKAASAE